MIINYATIPHIQIKGVKMYLECRKYNVIDGEPALGQMEECELKAYKFEVEDYIIEELYDNGTYPSDWMFFPTDDYTECDIEIDASEYVDVQMLEDYLDDDTFLASLDNLYSAANVQNPKYRKKVS